MTVAAEIAILLKNFPLSEKWFAMEKFRVSGFDGKPLFRIIHFFEHQFRTTRESRGRLAFRQTQFSLGSETVSDFMISEWLWKSESSACGGESHIPCGKKLKCLVVWSSSCRERRRRFRWRGGDRSGHSSRRGRNGAKQFSRSGGRSPIKY